MNGIRRDTWTKAGIVNAALMGAKSPFLNHETTPEDVERIKARFAHHLEG